MGNIDLLEDACARLPHSSRKMFGGHGLFANNNGGMFAGIVDDDMIVLKMEEGTAEHAAFRAVGAVPWVYKGKMGGGTTMKAWLLVPEALYDEPRALAEWAAKAYRIAPAKKPTSAGAKKSAAPPAKTTSNAAALKTKAAAMAKKPAPKKAAKGAAKQGARKK